MAANSVRACPGRANAELLLDPRFAERGETAAEAMREAPDGGFHALKRVRGVEHDPRHVLDDQLLDLLVDRLAGLLILLDDALLQELVHLLAGVARGVRHPAGAEGLPEEVVRIDVPAR